MYSLAWGQHLALALPLGKVTGFGEGGGGGRRARTHVGPGFPPGEHGMALSVAATRSPGAPRSMKIPGFSFLAQRLPYAYFLSLLGQRKRVGRFPPPSFGALSLWRSDGRVEEETLCEWSLLRFLFFFLAAPFCPFFFPSALFVLLGSRVLTVAAFAAFA
ncbi:hypothetical protein MTO96_018095 [Rhipicephalus appendiculatus]